MDNAAPPSEQAPGAPQRRSAWAETFYSFRYRDFRLLWFSTCCIAGGTWFMQVTLGWLAWEMTRDALQVGIILGLRTAPLLLSPVAGVLGDRFDRRRVLMVDQVFITALVVVFALLILFNMHQVWHLYAFATLYGIGWAANNPIRQILVATCVPRESLGNAIALIGIAFNSMRAIGPAIAGVMIVVASPGVNFLITGILFFMVSLLIIPFRARYGGDDRRGATGRSPLRNLGEGFAYVARDPLTLTTLCVTFALSVTIMAQVMGMLSVYAAEVLDDEDGLLLGLLTASLGIGGVVGTLAVARFSRINRKGMAASLAFGGAGLCMIALSLSSVFWMAAAVLAIMQACIQMVMALNQTIVHSVTPDNMRGRVTGVYQMEIGMTPIGTMMAGAIASLFGVQAAFMAGGVVGIGLIVFIAVFVPRYRRVEL